MCCCRLLWCCRVESVASTRLDAHDLFLYLSWLCWLRIVRVCVCIRLSVNEASSVMRSYTPEAYRACQRVLTYIVAVESWMRKWVLSARRSFGSQETVAYLGRPSVCFFCVWDGMVEQCFHGNGITMHNFSWVKCVGQAGWKSTTLFLATHTWLWMMTVQAAKLKFGSHLVSVTIFSQWYWLHQFFSQEKMLAIWVLYSSTAS